MRVFISSTVADLAPYRKAAERAALDAGWHPILLPEQPTVPFGQSVKTCVNTLLSCDAFISIIASRCGWVPTAAQGGNGSASITEIELGAWMSTHRKRQMPEPVILMSDGPVEVVASAEGFVERSTQTLLRHRLRQQGRWLHGFDWQSPVCESDQPLQSESLARSVAAFSQKLTHQLHNLKLWHANKQTILAQMDAQRERSAKTDGVALALIGGLVVGAVMASK